MDCKDCKYYKLEVTGTAITGSKIIETCLYAILHNEGGQELISDKRICMAFWSKNH